MNTDYTASAITVNFLAGAVDGDQRCITITAISDDILEEQEAVLIFIAGSDLYTIATDGTDYSHFRTILILDSTGELSISS